MPFEQHEEKQYRRNVTSIYQAALTAIGKLNGTVVASAPERCHLEVKFPKTILGKTLGERTYLTLDVTGQEETSQVTIDAYPLDAIDRKLLFGARKGVTRTVVNWLIEQIDQQLA
ncbi:MAG: hypothetical protein ACP5FH_08415 [Terracidiphilus sp.]